MKSEVIEAIRMLAKEREMSVVVETKTIAGLKESARWLHANK